MVLSFGPFELDLRLRELRLDGEAVPVGPRPFDLLAYLVERRDGVVTKDELMAALWPDTVVSDWALASTVKLARRALRHGADPGGQAVGIRTVHGRGFRFVGDVREGESGGAGAQQPAPIDAHPMVPSPRPAISLEGVAGRQGDLAELERVFARVEEGRPQVAVVLGEAGIGKTTLVDAFAEGLRSRGVRVGVGQSVEHYGRADAYLPVLEAWDGLLREPNAEVVAEMVYRHAPRWAPHLGPGADRTGSRAEAGGTVRSDAMVVEMAELLAATSESRPLVVVLEDVHWADAATIDLIAYLAEKRLAGRFLVVATCRPSDLRGEARDLLAIAKDLGGRERGAQLHLAPLDRGGVEDYLRIRLPGGSVSGDLIDPLLDRTDGQPLFLTNIVDVALREGRLVRTAGRWELSGDLQGFLPRDLERVIERQIDSLRESERHLLEAAAAVGTEFAAEAAAAALGQDGAGVEEACERLVWEERLIEDAGVEEWPDGTISGRYRFAHSLFAEVLYERLSSARRVRFHRAIGTRKEDAFGDRSHELAAELALHFERGKDVERAIRYHREAAHRASARQGEREAVEHLTVALDLLRTLGESAPRDVVAEVLAEWASGFFSARAPQGARDEVVEHMVALVEQLPAEERKVRILVALAGMFPIMSRPAEARRAAQMALEIAEGLGDPVAIVRARLMVGQEREAVGDLENAEAQLRQVLDEYDPDTHAEHLRRYGDVDPGAVAACRLGVVLHSKGEFAAAFQIMVEAERRATEVDHPLTTSMVQILWAVFRLQRREPEAARVALEKGRAVQGAEGFEWDAEVARFLEGWALLQEQRFEEAIEYLEGAVEGQLRMGLLPFASAAKAALGTAYGFAGRVEEARSTLDAAIAEATTHGAVAFEATAIQVRVMTLMLLGVMPLDEAVTTLVENLERCRRFGMRAGELATAGLLAEIYEARGEHAVARELLEPLVAALGRDSDLRDIRDALVLLDRLGG